MVKFPKLKIEIAISIKLSALLTLINTAAVSSSYWLKHVDSKTNVKLLMGLWRTCHASTGKCYSRSGITHDSATIWSLIVHILFVIGTCLNVGALAVFIIIFIFKQIKNFQMKTLMILIEVANAMMLASFLILIVAFGVFISTSCTYSLWLQVYSLCACIFASNFLTRIFAKLYYSFD